MSLRRLHYVRAVAQEGARHQGHLAGAHGYDYRETVSP